MKFMFAAAAVLALAAETALAAPSDYRFSVVDHARQADGTDTVTVRVVHLPDGKPVPGAIVFAPKASMGEHGAAMTAPARMLTPAADGAAVVQISPSMDGAWTLSLNARINGEASVVAGSVDVVLGK
jgi:hypothetical protein